MKHLIFTILLISVGICSFAQYTLKLSDIKIKGDTIVDFAPINGKEIKDIIIPAKFEDINITTIGCNSFSGFHKSLNLEHITISEGIKHIGNSAFTHNNIISISFPNTLETIGDSAFFYATSNDNSIEQLTIPNSVTSIGASAFEICIIKNVQLSDNIKVYRKNSFDGCGLKTISLSNSVERIEQGAFDNNEIEQLVIPNSVRYISGFASNNISELTIPSTIEIIGDSAFCNNQKLNNLTIPNGVKKIGKLAFSKSSDEPSVNEYIYIPQSVEYIGKNAFSFALNGKLEIAEGITRIDTAAFAGTDIHELILPSTIEEICPYAFYHSFGYPVLDRFTIPKSLKHIGSHAFFAAFIRQLDIYGNNLVIDKMAFKNTIYLEKINIRNGVTIIGDSCFAAPKVQRSLSVDMKNATDLVHIMPNAFADKITKSTFKLPLGKQWFVYDKTPESVDKTVAVVVTDDLSKGYIAQNASAIDNIQMQPSNVNSTIYDLNGHKVTEDMLQKNRIYIVSDDKGKRKIIVR